MVQLLGSRLVAAPQPGPHAGDELLRLERLDDVVVGAGLEPDDDVDGVGAGRQHDDGHAALGADPPAHLHAVEPRKHDVEEHEVGPRLAERGDRLGAVGHMRDLEALVAQHDPQHLGEGEIVVDDQYPTLHGTLLPGSAPRARPVPAHIFTQVCRPTVIARCAAPAPAASSAL